MDSEIKRDKIALANKQSSAKFYTPRTFPAIQRNGLSGNTAIPLIFTSVFGA